MICKDNLPLNTSEKDGFKFFIKCVEPLYKVPSKKTITRLIDEKYHFLSNIIKKEILEVKALTITTDIWTETMNTNSFLGLTCHYIRDCKLKSITVGVTELTEPHKAEYLGTTLKNICDVWNISLHKVIAVVTDNGSNIVKAVSDVFGKNKCIPCFAHTLNLVLADKTLDCSDELKDVINKVKHIVTYFKHNVNAADELRKSEVNKKLVQSVTTRCNSTYVMLKRFKKIIMPLI